MDTLAIEAGKFLTEFLVPLLGSLVLGLASVAAAYVSKKFKLENDNVLRTYFMDYVQKGVDYGKSQALAASNDGKFTFPVQNAAVAMGANFIMNQAPIAAKALNFSEAQIRDLVEAELGKQLGLVADPSAPVLNLTDPVPTP